jgi:hypothetical protein
MKRIMEVKILAKLRAVGIPGNLSARNNTRKSKLCAVIYSREAKLNKFF